MKALRDNLEFVFSNIEKVCSIKNLSYNKENVAKALKTSASKIPIVCNVHNKEFYPPYSVFISQQTGCPICGGTIKYSDNIELLLEKLEKVSDNSKFFYVRQEIIDTYKNSRSILPFYCKIHGKFFTTFSNFFNGQRCQQCVGKFRYTSDFSKLFVKLYEKCAINGLTFIEEEIEKEYKNYYSYLTFYCAKHGDVKISFSNFYTRNTGCGKCNTSNGETVIQNFLETYKIPYIPQKTFKKTNRMKFDFYLENQNILVEFQGIQHYFFQEFFHKTLEQFEKRKKYDELKREFCKETGIRLIEIDCRIYNTSEKIEELLTNLLLKGNQNEVHTFTCTQ